MDYEMLAKACGLTHKPDQNKSGKYIYSNGECPHCEIDRLKSENAAMAERLETRDCYAQVQQDIDQLRADLAEAVDNYHAACRSKSRKQERTEVELATANGLLREGCNEGVGKEFWVRGIQVSRGPAG